MKTKTKNFNALEQVFDKCEAKGDTLFAIYQAKNVDEGSVMFTGEASSISKGLASAIKDSLNTDEEVGADAVLNGVLNAISYVLAPKDKAAFKFADMITDAIDKANDYYKKFYAKKDDEDDDNDEFDPESKDCLECDDFAKCMAKALVKKAKELAEKAAKEQIKKAKKSAKKVKKNKD